MSSNSDVEEKRRSRLSEMLRTLERKLRRWLERTAGG